MPPSKKRGGIGGSFIYPIQRTGVRFAQSQESVVFGPLVEALRKSESSENIDATTSVDPGPGGVLRDRAPRERCQRVLLQEAGLRPAVRAAVRRRGSVPRSGPVPSAGCLRRTPPAPPVRRRSLSQEPSGLRPGCGLCRSLRPNGRCSLGAGLTPALSGYEPRTIGPGRSAAAGPIDSRRNPPRTPFLTRRRIARSSRTG